MFQAKRDEVLDRSRWMVRPDDVVQYVEGWKYSGANSSEPVRLQRTGFLQDSEISEWLRHGGAYIPPAPNPGASLHHGTVRLLICERLYYEPLSFSMSRESYLNIERAFNLSSATLPSFSIDSGIYSQYKTYNRDEPKKVTRLSVVMKFPQKFQLANYGLSITHDISTATTTALIHGTGALLRGADYKFWEKSQSDEILELIQSSWVLWPHPMLLPTLLLNHHLSRMERFTFTVLSGKLTGIQDQLGVTRAGRLSGKTGVQDIVGDKTINQAKLSMRDLTSDMSSLATDIAWFAHTSQWQCDCAEFLDKVMADWSNFVPQNLLERSNEIQEWIAYANSSAKTLNSYNNRLGDVMQSELSVLYSLVAQIDNRLNAKMSASSSRDSTAMKTLAFITTLFLPGTFVATLFSMEMFDWRATDSRVVSSNFWVYWVVTIPLTCFVATVWSFWWKWEKRNFDADVRQEIENIDHRQNPTISPPYKKWGFSAKETAETWHVRARSRLPWTHKPDSL